MIEKTTNKINKNIDVLRNNNYNKQKLRKTMKQKSAVSIHLKMFNN